MSAIATKGAEDPVKSPLEETHPNNPILADLLAPVWQKSYFELNWFTSPPFSHGRDVFWRPPEIHGITLKEGKVPSGTVW